MCQLVKHYFAIMNSTLPGQETFPPLNPSTYDPELAPEVESGTGTTFIPGYLSAKYFSSFFTASA